MKDPSQSGFMECTVYEKKKEDRDRIAAVNALFVTGHFCKIKNMQNGCHLQYYCI